MPNRFPFSLTVSLAGLCTALFLMDWLNPALFGAHGPFAAAIAESCLLVAIYLLARGYNLSPADSSVTGLAIVLSCYMLYFHQGGGDGAPLPLAFLFLSWAAMRWMLRAESVAEAGVVCALAVFVTLALGRAIEYAALLIVLVATCAEGVAAGGRRGALVSAAVVFGFALYWPLMGPLGVHWNGWIASNGTLTPSIGQILGLSNPISLPRVAGAGGAPLPFAPLFFASWFPQTLFFHINWRQDWKKHLHLGCITGVFLLLATGAERIGPLCWPVDWLPYVQACFVILIFRAIGQGRFVAEPRRTVWSLIAFAVTSYTAVMDNPVAVLPVIALALLPLVLIMALSEIAKKDKAWIVPFFGVTTAIMAIILVRVFPDIYMRPGGLPPIQPSLFGLRHAWRAPDFLPPLAGLLLWLHAARNRAHSVRKS